MTTYAKKILELIEASDCHMTAEQVFDALRSTYPRVVLATVYNNLNRLCAQGAVRKVSVEGMPDRYDKTWRHDHLVCKHCGKLMDVSFEDLTAPLRKQLGQDFLFYDLKVYYLCPECRAAMERVAK